MPKNIRINGQIQEKEIRLIGALGEKLGIVSSAQALITAQQQQMDLVEVAPLSKPPVCRIMDYCKYRYEQNKKEREAKKKQKTIHFKEIRIKPKIEEHDYQVKFKQLKKFLEHHDKVKVTMTFRGREISHMEFGKGILERLEKDISEIGELEKPSVREGKNIIMTFKPK